jgi:hypothetical protein
MISKSAADANSVYGELVEETGAEKTPVLTKVSKPVKKMSKVVKSAPEPEEEMAKVVAPKQVAAPAPSTAPAQLSEAAD